MANNKILILDFGSQYTQLIARRIREHNVYCEIHPYDMEPERVRYFSPDGIILSGGPSSIFEINAPRIEDVICHLGIPVLGICYGMQLLAYMFRGRVEAAKQREYGSAEVYIDTDSGIFNGMSGEGPIKVWMSHGDRITSLPDGFIPLAHSSNSPIAAMGNKEGTVFGLQFHPEVSHTDMGVDMIKNFLFEICGSSPSWTMKSFIENTVVAIKERAEGRGIICGISGGVDSAVTAALVHRAVGDQLTCIFVDNGLLRQDEARKVCEILRGHFNMRLRPINAGERFLSLLKGVEDPEEKRKVIGNEFIRVFEEEAKKLKNVAFLAQGTLYPDVIESLSSGGPSSMIKSHHNVGGLLEDMHLELVEPLRELFKDEVRILGRELGLPEGLVGRHPFPGPGLAIRIIGEVTGERCDVLRMADTIVIDEIKSAGWYGKMWQGFAVLLPVRSVGVMGDRRTYEDVLAVRTVSSVDGMTADWVRLPYDLMSSISNRIINEVKGVNRVVYDITSKPPGTIEWE